ncbi:hypothetical protein J6590_012166 [Homalodisca vitripennis]|nr:hypothetical protein J6590_012166 [Homalodisca vitripennis]
MSLGDQLSLSTLPHVLLTVSDESWRSAQFIYATACTADSQCYESWRPAQFIYATACTADISNESWRLSTLPHVLLTVSDESWRSAQFIYATACTADSQCYESWRPAQFIYATACTADSQ